MISVAGKDAGRHPTVPSADGPSLPHPQRVSVAAGLVEVPRDPHGRAGPGTGEFTYPSGVAAGTGNHVYVVELGIHRVQEFIR